jgi:drug/metabolite transporter (DMT)-like permease
VIDLSSPLVGGGMALSASALWAASTTVFKAPIVRDGPRAMNLFRVAIAFLLFWTITLALDGAAGFGLLATHAGGLLVLSGALGLALGDFFLFFSVKEIGAQPAVTLNLLSPVWSAALGALLGSEHLRWQQFGAIALVIGGVVLVIRSKASGDLEPSADELPVIDDDATRRRAEHGRHGLGLIAGLASSLCNACAGMISHEVVAEVGALRAGTLRVTGALALLLLAGFALRTLRSDARPLATPRGRGLQIASVLLASCGGIFLQQGAFERVPASVALCLLSTTPIFLLPLAVGILRERYGWNALLGTVVALAGVVWLVQPGERPMAVRDPHSFARPEQAVVRRLELDLTVDFAARRLRGRATLDVELAPGATELVLDTRDLEITAVTAGTKRVAHRLAKAEGDFGRALTIPLVAGTKQVTVEYATSPGAAALQWLAPEQTAGRRLPFLFTQSQAILARTWVPCQDTPSVRMTYHAKVAIADGGGAPPGDFLALMSASNPQAKSRDGRYEFDMPQPIPSYLLALAVGDLEFRPLGKDCGVYAEKPVVEGAAKEFADLDAMIRAAEKLYGPYRFGRYDVIVLPPSFPFGGMENPRLTFATPTILAGDRSLVSLVAHELAHSWSGNLVTNATWNDFWLNEGFTVYFEHRIMEAVFGKEFDEALAVLGLQDLEKTLGELKDQPKDTCLELDLAGRNPDDGVTDVAYEKGARFLQVIERAVGRERFDRFLRGWFDQNAFQSRTTAEFLAYLRKELVAGDAKLEASLQIEAWVHQPGLPSNCPRPTSSALARADAQGQRLAAGAKPSELDVAGFTTQQWQQFLRSLPPSLSNEQLAALDAQFGLSGRGNSEVLFAWLVQCVARRYEPGFPALERFLTSQGRRKFLKPLYQELAKSDWGRALAVRIYEKARPTYHAVSRDTIDELLQWGK